MYSQQIGAANTDIANKKASSILNDEKRIDSLYTVLERMILADAKQHKTQ